MRQVTASAPGKLVLWGEYAVLAGAPAVALAVNRRAECQFTTLPGTRTWQLQTPGLTSGTRTLSLDGLLISSAPAAGAPEALLWHVLCTLKGATNTLPMGGTLIIDSSAFHSDHTKLGLGSSAAVCTALTGLLQTLAGIELDEATAFRAHRAAQGGKGSGIDVAAALCGALVLMRPDSNGSPPVLAPYAWPESLHWQALWTGQSAATVGHIRRFDDWRQTAPAQQPAALAWLCRCAEALAAGLTLDRLRRYSAALYDVDRVGQLGIYTPLHTKLHNLARVHQVQYKPCGAGGGDAGIAISDDPERLAAFISAAAASAPSVHPLDLRLATDGIRITS